MQICGPYPQGILRGTQWLWWRCSLALQLVPRDGTPVCCMIPHFPSNIPVVHAAFSKLYSTFSIIHEINMLKEIIKWSTKAYGTCGEAAIGILDCFSEGCASIASAQNRDWVWMERWLGLEISKSSLLLVTVIYLLDKYLLNVSPGRLSEAQGTWGEQADPVPTLRKKNFSTGVRYFIDNHWSAFYLWLW